MAPREKTKTKTISYGTVRVHKHDTNEWAYVQPLEIGDLKFSAKLLDHYGWLKCDGRAISRTVFSELFEEIGTSFGVGNGSTTFNLPDARGRVLGAIGTGTGLTARSLGDIVGTERHTLTIPEMPSHNHGITDPGHTHTYANNSGDQGVNTLTTQEDAADQIEYNQTSGSSTTGITINNTGGDQSHNNMQPTEFIGSVFIFAKYMHSTVAV